MHLEEKMIQKKMKRPTVAQPQRNAKAAVNVDKIALAIATVDQVHSDNPKTTRALALLKQWLRDGSGYDEETWPQLQKALDQERRRVGARSLFDG
jgi:hypothetical protein